MSKMTMDEAREFLSQKARTAKIATTRANGRPHVAPVWFVLDGDDLIFTTWHTTVKATNIRRDPHISICVDDDQPPYAFVLIDGTATLSDDLNELRTWATRLGGRYMGEDKAEAFGQRNGVAGELLVRVTPTKIIAEANISD